MLRLAHHSDIEAVFAIYMHESVIPYLGYDPMPLEDFRPLFTELVKSRSFFVMERDGRVKGFCRASWHPGRAAHVAYLETLAVSADERGSGLARQLIEQVISELQRQGVLRVELMVEADNPRALAFYKKLGFQHEGTLRAAYKRSHEEDYIDELFLAKLLAPLRTKNMA
jgi:ribosomal protein S18 acetylase RimI-like enzyme